MSGLADGLDSAGHRAAVGENCPTIAVMGVPIDRTYPAANRELRRAIERRGCVISEYPPESEPVGAVGFLQRNRLIAVLSGALVVVEAKEMGFLIVTTVTNGTFPLDLPEADLIALSLPGTPETNKLFNAERFARCKDGAILINVGRGTTVDSDALVEALRSGKIFGAGLDVTDPEPLPADHPLWGEPGAIITPHNSGKFSLPKTLDNIVDIFIHNLKRYAEGLPLDNQVNRTTRYAADQNGGHRLLSTL